MDEDPRCSEAFGDFIQEAAGKLNGDAAEVDMVPHVGLPSPQLLAIGVRRRFR